MGECNECNGSGRENLKEQLHFAHIQSELRWTYMYAYKMRVHLERILDDIDVRAMFMIASGPRDEVLMVMFSLMNFTLSRAANL